MTGSSESGGWIELGRLAPDVLAESSLALHWAAQIPAALGSVLIEARDDDSHSNLGWVGDERGFLEGHRLELDPPFRVGIRPVGLRLEVVSATGRRISGRSLVGRTLAEGLASAKHDLESVGGEKLPEIPLRDYGMPEHAVQEGEPFAEPSEAEMLEIGRWFCNFTALFADLEDRASERRAARSVDAARVWPHHFDLGMLLHVAEGALRFVKGQLQLIGIGLSLGDEHIAEPYVYVNPYPSPDPAWTLPDLGSAGRWQRDGFVGAVLPGSELVAAGGAPSQEAAVRGFLDRALTAFLGR